MTDPARAPEARPSETPDWSASLRRYRYAEAAARARLAMTPADIVASLDDLANVERAVKEKRYAAARRSLHRYREGLGSVQDATALRAFVNAEDLERGVNALEATEKSRLHEVEELHAQLEPAFAHPLTAPEAHNSIGVLHALREEPEAARAAFDRTLELDTSHYRALTNIGNLLLEAGDPAAAEGYYRRALEINKDYPGAHHNLAVALRKQKKLTASVRSLKTSQRLAVRQLNQDGRADARERLGKIGFNPSKVARWVLTVVAGLLAFFFLRGQGL